MQKEYCTLKSSGSYFGPQKLYHSLNARDINDISVYKIRQWLNSQDDHSLQKPTRHPYKRVRVVISGVDNQWDANLADMSSLSKYNKGVTLLLVVIDIFFLDFYGSNRKKKSLKKLGKDLKRLYRKVVNIKKQLRTDKGWEFSNRLLQEFFFSLKT